MRLYLLAASVGVALLLQTQVMAQAPPTLSVEVVTPEQDKWAHLLELSTSLDTVDLALHIAPSMLRAEVDPPHYDYRNARKVERHYNRVRRYYRRQGRRDNRAIQQQSHHNYVLQRRESIRQSRQRKKALNKAQAQVEERSRNRK